MNLDVALRILEQKQGAVFSVHVLHPAFLECEALRLAPDQYLHHGEFCRTTKMHGGDTACARNKDRSLELAKRGRFFCGTCPFGVWDAALPVLFESKTAAVIYAGSFHLPEHAQPSKEKIAGLHRDMEFLRELILLELELWRKTAESTKQRPADYYIRNINFFIDRHFPGDPSLEEAAETLRVTPNYLGELIRRETGRSFRELLLERRIKEARVYLKLHRHLSVTRIASLCGFHDSNYFSTCFRRIAGCSPREYRAVTDGTASDATR